MLPLEIIYNITQYLIESDILKFRSACRYFSLIRFEITSSYYKIPVIDSNYLIIRKVKVQSFSDIKKLQNIALNITHLIIENNNEFNEYHQYENVLILENLTHLIFEKFTYILISVFPSNLQYLEFDEYLNSVSHINRIKKAIEHTKIRLILKYPSNRYCMIR
jgi:hypothetical protein